MRPDPHALFATDIDGTLMDGERRIPERNLDALRRATAAGVEVALVTGRRRSSLQPVLDQLAGLRYRVGTSNGGVVLDPSNRWTEEVHALDWGLLDRLAGETRLAHAPLFFMTAPAIDAASDDGNPDCFILVPGSRAWHTSWTPYRAETLEPTTADVARRRHMVHLVLYAPTRAEAESFDALLRPDLPADASSHVVTSPFDDGALTEIVPRGGKGLAVRYLARSLGIDPGRTAGIGDELNDVDLIDACAVGYAVDGSRLASARPDAQRVAAPEAGGVAAAIDDFLARL